MGETEVIDSFTLVVEAIDYEDTSSEDESTEEQT